ncbi:SDR family NAD(P)-dependent oxidoreductase [Streptomyces turgidiscabies]|uniref:Oxidoreductase, short chain dehydrogenase/reductase family protein n=1 Tax=Streptomyces turgidiscabies (strain Car8) TaxID=698760 RepID=L7EX54_STRT8|nr:MULTISPECIES: 3-oxoacyl-ACP reductase family protein [Streptomyces]ELP63464.1 oxidoreductase, short chain dehydrogenase/reductase family protein [Streptomyces turgidiscabies Car8]MDX3497819.1 3-oxoacyl-ACP reductase FabG [Streptomyces turgidiscabies]GAQ69723.1 cyclic-di-GMP-binding biofilm dispersal mediator [Streptomyces turgidiscabies]
MNRLEGNVALITGGSRGIGAATALRLAEEGADVVVTYENSLERAAEVVKQVEALGRRGLAIQADSAVPQELTAAVDEVAATFGRLDILVNNAGVFLVGPLDDLGPVEIDRTLAVNVRAPFVASQAAARHMGDGGRIISIGSNVAGRAPFPGLALYSMSKTALVGMAKGLARELGPRGITVNVVHPGPTDTDANPADGPNAEAIAGFTAVGRYAEAAEIAATVAHLASVDGRYITGAEIHVDGGFTA